MHAHWIRVSWLVALVSAASLPACTPHVTGGDGKEGQASQGVDEDGDGKPDPEPGDGKPGPACQGFPIGDGTTCMTSEDIQSAAEAACAAVDLIAVDIGPGWNCADGASSIAKVLCCDSGEPATVPDDPPPSGPSPAGGFGDGTCAPNSDYLQQALDVCSSMGLSLIDLYTSDDADCPAGQSRWAKYICGE